MSVLSEVEKILSNRNFSKSGKKGVLTVLVALGVLLFLGLILYGLYRLFRACIPKPDFEKIRKLYFPKGGWR